MAANFWGAIEVLVLILCGDENKVSKTLRLKVNRKLYEINMVEVEWRTDLDWWLFDGDWSYDTATESEYSLSKNGDEDHGLFNVKICGEEYGSNEDEQLQKEGDSNLNGKSLTAMAGDGKDGVYSNGPVLSKENGLEIESEPVVSLYQEKESIRASRGLLCVWNKLDFVNKGEFKGDGFLGITGEWGPSKVKCSLVNVYAPNDKQKKVQLWNKLKMSILEEDEVVDHGPDGSSPSRLDRILMMVEMSNMGKEWAKQGLQRTVSNHCAIILKTTIMDWGLKPFRVLDAYQQHLEFKNVVDEKWKDSLVIEEPDLVKKEVTNDFHKLCQKESWNRPKPSSINFSRISTEQKEWLERPFIAEEIEEGLKSCDGSKALGLDGLIKEFVMGKGLSQGDPLSPLFLLVGEGLHGLVQKAKEEGLLHGVEIGRREMSISLLQFEDDITILGKAESGNIWMVKIILQWFKMMSGLRINFHKSSVCGFNVSMGWLNDATGVLCCGVGETPFIYLGMPVGGSPRSKKLWDPVEGQMRVMGAKSTSKKLGIVREVVNLRVSKLWEDIVRVGGKSLGLRKMLVGGFRWELGKGSSIGFWSDSWVGDKSLRDLCPRLFQLASNKEGVVKELEKREKEG
ncbi:hypothetical protein SLEP1_g14697 [Rubroshorea leprosula]|uniref:Reverse transcriptase domain-containing protein n=1 Tax=Rubroshorea leprosula TaxID=152421 RepID=A0AAV5IQU1_9ROSI|nr:hypothetical protein SLEP1_g14697 [Rubroshorea leprosula]